jgi:hypothetical protein
MAALVRANDLNRAGSDLFPRRRRVAPSKESFGPGPVCGIWSPVRARPFSTVRERARSRPVVIVRTSPTRLTLDRSSDRLFPGWLRNRSPHDGPGDDEGQVRMSHGPTPRWTRWPAVKPMPTATDTRIRCIDETTVYRSWSTDGLRCNSIIPRYFRRVVKVYGAVPYARPVLLDRYTVQQYSIAFKVI